MAKLSLSRAWDETRASLAGDGKLYVALALALIALPATIYGTLAPSALLGGAPQEMSMQLLFLLILAVNALGRLAISRLALRHATVGESIGHALQRILPLAAAFILFMLPVVLLLTPFLPAVMAAPENPPPGALLASSAIIIAAFIFGVRLALPLVPIAAAEQIGPIALLKRAWRITSGNWWRLAAFLIIFFTASLLAARAVGYVLGGTLILLSGPLEPMAITALILAAVLAVVGAAFTTVFSIMLARIYVQLSGPDHAGVSVPSSGT